MRHDECCAIYVKRDEDTRKRIELLYHYVNTLPLTKHQRGKLIRLAEEALVSAEGNGFYTGTCDIRLRKRNQRAGIANCNKNMQLFRLYS